MKRHLKHRAVVHWQATQYHVHDRMLYWRDAHEYRMQYMSLQHRCSHKQHSCICSNRQQYSVWLKIIIFLLWQKWLDIKIVLHEHISTVNISKLNYWLLICIAKNLIWKILKMIFSILNFFCILRFSNIVQTIHQWKYYLLTLMTGFVHVYLIVMDLQPWL